MLKKKIITILAMTLLVCLTACSTNNSVNTEQLTQNAQVAEQKPEEQERPQRPTEKTEQLKWLVSEFQHRHYVSLVKNELQDVSDIAQDNVNMELWRINTLWSIKNNTPKVSLVEKTVSGTFEIMDETNEEIKVKAYAQTVFYQPYQEHEYNQSSVGDEYIVTFKKNGDNYVIVSCDTNSNTYYNNLKNAFNGYVNSGMTEKEAVNRIYASEGLENVK